ncbi:MAG: HPr kinase/phosphorylase [Sphingorhabdus sp.]
MNMAVNPYVEQLHATGIAIDGHGIALIGPSGSGKSDLALRLIDRGAQLVCDDRLHVFGRNGQPWIGAFATIAGKIEVRGLGIIQMDHIEKAPLRLLVNLDQQPDRLPDPWPLQTITGFEVPELRLNAFEASAAIKVELALVQILAHMDMAVRQDNETT